MFGPVRAGVLVVLLLVVHGGTAADPLGPSSRRSAWVISEVMFHPRMPSGGEELEFVEIHNAGLIAEDLGGHRLSGAWEFQFPSGAVVPAGGFAVVSPDPAGIEEAYGLDGVLGGFTNRLSNSEGQLRLVNPAGAVLLEFEYSDRPPWPAAADGAGHSLVLERPSYGEGDPRAWSPSAAIGGSPGRHEPSAGEEAAMINELLAHTDDPQLDFVELFNPTDREIDLSGCRVTDGVAREGYRIPGGTVLQARGRVAFDQTQLGFALEAAGESVFLFSADDRRVLDAVRFGAQANGVAFGRWPDGAPEWSDLQAPTPGLVNSPPRQPEVVIHEILYHPISAASADEFIELHNPGADPVELSGWELREGIEFVFPVGTLLPGGAFIVVTPDRSRFETNYPGVDPRSVFGNYRGNLSDAGELVVLARPELLVVTNADLTLTTNRVAVVVDEVAYGDGGRWGRWSDGGGSSLELRDSRAENRLGVSWADSDETGKAPWTMIEHTGVMDHGVGAIDSLQVLLEGAGACLVDDVEVLGANGQNRVGNPAFDIGTGGWTFEGTHVGSGWEGAEGAGAPGSLWMEAEARGDTGANRIRTAVSAGLASGSTATLRASVRWLRGCPDLLLRLRGNYLEAAGRLNVPGNLGTPAAPNSRMLANAPPAIWEAAHEPILPAAGEAVRITARIQDPDGVAAVELRYRLDPDTNFTTLPMRDDGTSGDRFGEDGLFSALLPGQASGQLVAFHIVARDGAAPAVSAMFPDDTPRVEGLIRFGEARPSGGLGVYRLWMTQATFSRWSNRPKLDNTPLPLTFVYNEERVVHGVGGLYAGSPHISPGYSTPSGNLCGYVLVFPEDEPFLGAQEVVLDWPGRDSTAQQEPMAYWLARELQIPFNHRRYIRLHVNGRTESQRGSIYEDAQQVNGDLIESWLPDGAGGDLFKIEQWFEFADNGSRYHTGPPRLENYTTSGGVKKTARYRWNWLPRAVQGSPHDFARLFTLVDVANTTDPQTYARQIEDFIDVEEWMRVFAVEHMIVNLDSWGYDIGKNMYAYKPPRRRWQLYMWDIDWVMLASAQHGYSPTSPLMYRGAAPFGEANRDPAVGRMYDHPGMQRAYWRAIRDAVNGPLLTQRVTAQMDATYAALVANGVTHSAGQTLTGPGAVKSWLTQRRTFLLSQLATVASPFAVQGATLGAANTAFVAGTAPIEVARLLVNDRPYPVSWTSVTNWQIEVPLTAGPNLLNVVGVDRLDRSVPGAVGQAAVDYPGPVTDPAGEIVLNEIHYHPPLPGSAFVELFNRSATTAFDLSGWELEGAGLVFPAGSWIGPGGFVVAANDRQRLAEAQGIECWVTAEFEGQLRNDGETLRLIDPGNATALARVIDQVTYDDEAPWPEAADGHGPSLQLVDSAQDNRRPGNWAALLEPQPVPPQVILAMTNRWRYDDSGGDLGTGWREPDFLDGTWPEGAALLYNESAALPGPKNTPLVLGARTYYFRTQFSFDGDPAAVALQMTTIIDDGAVFHLNAHEWFTLGMPTNNPIDFDTLASRNTPDATLEGPFILPATWLERGGNLLAVEVHQVTTDSPDVTFGLALDAIGRGGISATPGRPNSTLRSLTPIPSLWLNEFQPVNANGARDQFGEAEPWVELFNAGTGSVSLVGCYLTDTPTNAMLWAFPAGSALGPGERLLVWLDGEPAESGNGELHAAFRPTGGTGYLGLTGTVDSQPFVLDYIRYGGMEAGYAVALLPDGNGDERRILTDSTPGAANGTGPTTVTVRFNEWMASNQGAVTDPADGDFDDWFELHNLSTVPADLTGFFLSDDTADLHKYTIPAGTKIPARGFLLCWADEEGSQTVLATGLHVNFRLSQGGEQLYLTAPDGTIVDAVDFGAQTTDVAEGRWPDGTSSIATLAVPTPGAANALPVSLSQGIHVVGIVASEAGRPTVMWTTAIGGIYRLQGSDDLSTGAWQDLTPDLIASGTFLTATDPAPGNGQRFYRVVRLDDVHALATKFRFGL